MHTAKQIVAPRMQALQKLEKSLKRLDLSWKVIETTARVVSPPESAAFISTLEHTRAAFSHLAAEMVDQIAHTYLSNCNHDLTSRAQVAIDILVRNLFERTADVGFIATDGPLVQFVQAPDEQLRTQLHARLTEYRNKYTVYDDILVLNASAQLLLSLKPNNRQDIVTPAWWSEVLSKQGYVECYGRSGLFNTAENVLIYSHRIVADDGYPCGVVILKFDLQSELMSIFKALQHESSVIAVLDEHSRVVTSSNTDCFAPLETVRLPKARQQSIAQTIHHKGVDYLFSHCGTRSYQGYSGPGWTALALVRLDEAFESSRNNTLSTQGKIPDTSIEIELEHAELQQIVARARTIGNDLNRVIWNGKLNESGNVPGSALSPVFSEIGRTSKQTIAAFDAAILELKSLLLLGKRVELTSHATLAVDIMDRNLYERANDCRWWVLSEELTDLLQTLQVSPSDTTLQRASEILAHLNSLYTVYRRVALFDRQGRVVAVSRDAQTLAENTEIPAALLQRTFALKGTQAYTVSSMAPHALADGEATYLYCAPIRKIGEDQPLGGVALAFNCTDELTAMLNDSLPTGGTTLGFFLNHDGRVLASTDLDIAVGDCPDFSPSLSKIAGGYTEKPWCIWKGKTFLVGFAKSKGYREFKTTDGYRDDVQSVMLTAVNPSPALEDGFVLPQPHLGFSESSTRYGVVQCGSLLLALASTHVVAAVSASNMSAPVIQSDSIGMLKFSINGHVDILPVYDTCKLTGQAPIANPEQAVAIVLRNRGRTAALIVDRLIDVIECASTEAPPGGTNPDAPWISGFIHDSRPHTEAVFVIDPNELPIFQSLQTP